MPNIYHHLTFLRREELIGAVGIFDVQGFFELFGACAALSGYLILGLPFFSVLLGSAIVEGTTKPLLPPFTAILVTAVIEQG